MVLSPVYAGHCWSYIPQLDPLSPSLLNLQKMVCSIGPYLDLTYHKQPQCLKRNLYVLL